MAGKFNHVTVKLIHDESDFDQNLLEESLFLQIVVPLNLSRVVAQLAPETKKDESLGSLWSNIKPSKDGYVFEIATKLPYFLPNYEDKSEFLLNIDDKKYFICNRMVQIFYDEGFPDNDGYRYYISHIKGLEGLANGKIFTNAHLNHLKTFISRRFVGKGSNAEDLIEKNFISWRDEFISDVAFLVESIRTTSPEPIKHLLPHASIASYPIFWIAIQGEDPKTIGCEQFTGDLNSVALRPQHNLDSEAATKLNTILSGKTILPPHLLPLDLADTFCHYGYLELSIIQVCISLETYLSGRLRENLLKKGMSQNHLKTYFDDVTFSQLLNLHLPSFVEITQLAEYKDIFGKINWGRRRRNKLLHLGGAEENITKEDTNSLIDATKKLIRFVDNEFENQTDTN